MFSPWAHSFLSGWIVLSVWVSVRPGCSCCSAQSADPLALPRLIWDHYINYYAVWNSLREMALTAKSTMWLHASPHSDTHYQHHRLAKLASYTSSPVTQATSFHHLPTCAGLPAARPQQPVPLPPLLRLQPPLPGHLRHPVAQRLQPAGLAWHACPRSSDGREPR